MINIEKHLNYLPDEVRKQLCVSAQDLTRAAVEQLFIAHGKLSLDEVIVGLYVEHGIKVRRPAITARLKKLVLIGDLQLLPGRAYAAKPAPASEKAASPPHTSVSKPVASKPVDDLPPGAQARVDNIYYKRGVHGKIFRWNPAEKEWRACLFKAGEADRIEEFLENVTA